MSQVFRVRHLPPGSAAVSEELLGAASAQALRSLLEQRGSVVLELRASKASRAETPVWWGHRRRFNVSWWCRELETLLRAGMSPVEAIETLAAGHETGVRDDDRDRVHKKLVSELHQGAALSEAMRRSGAFPAILIAGVAASERTSTLATALTDYIRYDELLERLRRQAASAALYPAMVVALGALIAAFLLLFVIPRFSRMYANFPGPLSAPTEWVLGLSVLMREHGATLAFVAATGSAIAVVAWRRGGLKPRLLQTLDTLPGLRQPIEHFRLAQLYRAMSMLVNGGFTADESLKVVSRMDLGPNVPARIARVRDAVERGKAISSALAGAGLADVVAERLLSVGERGGDFSQILLTIGERHAREFATFVERATRLLEPLLLLIVALVIGGLVVMMYMPIFDIASGGM